MGERVEILSLGYTDPRVEATKKRWYQALKPFSLKAHYHAANLAAHNWDVLLIGDRILLFQTKYGGDAGHWVNLDGSHEVVSAAEMNLLYRRGEDGAMHRLFDTDAASLRAIGEGL